VKTTTSSELKRAANGSQPAGSGGAPVQKKAKGLWLGAGLDDLEDDDDLSDSEDESEDAGNSKVVALV
jgi:hypothetical protein